MTCEAFNERIYEALYGLLEGEELSDFNVHLGDCAVCRRHFERGGRALRMLSEERPLLPRPGLADDTIRRISLQGAGLSSRQPLSWLRIAAVVALSSCVGVVLLSGLLRHYGERIRHAAPDDPLTWGLVPREEPVPVRRIDEVGAGVQDGLLPVAPPDNPVDAERSDSLADVSLEAPGAFLPLDKEVAGERAALVPRSGARIREPGLKKNPGGGAVVSLPARGKDAAMGQAGDIPGVEIPKSAAPIARVAGETLGAGMKSIELSGMFSCYWRGADFRLSVSEQLTVIDDAKAMPGHAYMPYRGITVPDKTDHRGPRDVSMTRPWFEDRVEDVLALYGREGRNPGFFTPSAKRPAWKLFLCRAFLKDMEECLGQDGTYSERDDLKKRLTERYIRAASHFAYKSMRQEPVKNPPRFKSLVSVLQPLMASFAYGDAWIAIAECYASSEVFTQGRDIYRDYFCNNELMMVMRRRFQIPLKESDITASLLMMKDEVFAEYSRACFARWLDKGQYRPSAYEKAEKQ